MILLTDEGECLAEPLKRGRLWDFLMLGDFRTLGDFLTLSVSVASVVRESRAVDVVTVYPESRFMSSRSFDWAELPPKLGWGEVVGRNEGWRFA